MHPLADCLLPKRILANKGADTLSPLLRRSQRLQELAKIVGEEDRAPHGHFRVANLHTDGSQTSGGQSSGETLVIFADHPHTALRLRQLVPSLLTRLRNHDISKITIKTQPNLTDNEQLSSPPRRFLSRRVARHLSALAPQTELGHALQALVARSEIRD